MSDQKVKAILQRWRDLERELALLDRDGERYDSIEYEIENLRREYQGVTAGAVAAMDQLGAAARESYLKLAVSKDLAESSRRLVSEDLPEPPPGRDSPA